MGKTYDVAATGSRRELPEVEMGPWRINGDRVEMKRLRRSIGAVMAIVVIVMGVSDMSASAHEERASQFPTGTGATPLLRTRAEAADILVVCKPDSAARIAALADPAQRALNMELLPGCRFQHLQAAVDSVRRQRTNIYVLPGVYREEPSWSPECVAGYDGRVVAYKLVAECGEVINLITIAGDDPADPDISCDNALCHLQIEGTGSGPEDVVFTGGFREDGDWVKHNVLKADRADGIYLKNMTFELARENAVYVHETDGYAIDRVVGRNNELYGILTFASDHGVIRNCETHHNGDSGVYPGSAADVNAGEAGAHPLQRWSVEVTGCNIHHNGVGLAGTAGNSLYVHDNDIHHNGLGLGVDSYVEGHPGMPQDHAWIEANRIFSNNENFFVNVQGDAPPCGKPRPVDRGYESGLVCPTTPVPIGTGIAIVGGNANLVRRNEIFDNWRYGVMLAWVPGALRNDFAIEAQTDTSHSNEFRSNRFGVEASNASRPNGLDVWWDDQGLGNCWQDNVTEGQHLSTNARGRLPNCDTGGSRQLIGSVSKTGVVLPCARYNRRTQPDPVGCRWLTSPRPPGSSPGERWPGAWVLLVPVGAMAVLLLSARSRRRKARS